MNPYSESKNLNDVFKALCNKINKPLAKEIIKDVTAQLKTRYHYGEWFNHCHECNNEITKENPGQEITWIEDNQEHVMHLCNKCFMMPHLWQREVTNVKTEKYTGL